MQDPAAPPAPAPQVITIPSSQGIRIIDPQGVVVDPGIAGDPVHVYQGAVARREELQEQMEQLEEKRGELVAELSQNTGGDATVAAGLRSRIAEMDKRISDVDQQLAEANAVVSRVAAIPGAIVEHDEVVQTGPDEDIVAMGLILTLALLLPFVIAWSRRIWRRAGATPVASALPEDWTERMNRLEQSVDSIAIEVERVSEGQRFMTRVITEGSRGGAQAIDGAREPVPVMRGKG
jgi:hypothetical protein